MKTLQHTLCDWAPVVTLVGARWSGKVPEPAARRIRGQRTGTATTIKTSIFNNHHAPPPPLPDLTIPRFFQRLESSIVLCCACARASVLVRVRLGGVLSLSACVCVGLPLPYPSHTHIHHHPLRNQQLFITTQTESQLCTRRDPCIRRLHTPLSCPSSIVAARHLCLAIRFHRSALTASHQLRY